MALEPLSSVMTFQAQDAVKPKVQSVQPVDMEVSPDDQAAKVDATTASIVKAQAEDDEAGSGNDKEKDAGGNPRQALNSQQAASEPLKKAIA